MDRFTEIKNKIEELSASNSVMIEKSTNENEKEYYKEYGKNIDKLSKVFMKSMEGSDKDRLLDEFFISNDSLKKKMSERKKLALSNGLLSHVVRSEINSSIDFFLLIENVLINNIPKNA